MDFLEFFRQNIPTLPEFLVGFPLFGVYAYAALFFAGWLKTRRSVRTGYTRKIFHFLIFTTASLIQAFLGLRLLCLFGTATSAVIAYALLRGEGHLLYEAMAREKDAPHRTYFIITPYLATLFGGILSNVLFGEAALAGYLVTGFGDAIGEPVGTRFGRHPYRVPSLFATVASTRTLEGSTAVCLVSFLALALARVISPIIAAYPPSWLALAGIAMLCAVAEAFSPHGWDNMVLQILPSGLLTLFLSS